MVPGMWFSSNVHFVSIHNYIEKTILCKGYFCNARALIDMRFFPVI